MGISVGSSARREGPATTTTRGEGAGSSKEPRRGR